MSAQSGITVSKPLLEATRNLPAPIVITISSNQTEIEVDPAFSSSSCTSSSSLSGHFDSIHKYIKSIYPQPKYILIPSEPLNILISFIPDDAPIRQKMLYASSKNALISELGLGLLESYAWTELEELTYEYYKSARNLHLDPQPLTEEEKLNDAINALQATGLTQNYYKRELTSMHTNSNTHSNSDGLLYAFDSDLTDSIDQWSQSTLISFGINDTDKKIQLNLVNKNVAVDSIIPTLQSASPTPIYAVYNYLSGGPMFIYACPLGSKVKDRMLYASFKQDLLNHLKSKHGLHFIKSFEVGDLDELELSEFSGVSTPESEPASGRSTPDSRLKFSKPKGPRRR
ncbi:Twinfilin-1 [Scheffersomyces spartinae]|uniref:Twinfilin-1 n=1 Tax=Scheffersomyces spartinae TaxID=45513 RepID=A0A9P8AHG1_9ASCO|nr:Twinfilin-1 [Scheffersomyces spartinae]KAG7192658.1 Twinfilin-1 [Scheffersomyces spartinae]